MQFDDITLKRTDGIADKTPFSRLMCETLDLGRPQRLLDIGCGSGIIGLYCLLNGSEFVYFNDIQQAAINLTQENIAECGIDKSRYQLISSPFQDFDLNQHPVDAIAFNPPQLPTDLVDIGQFQENSERIFRDGGNTGRNLIDAYIQWLGKNMPENTKAYLGVSSVLLIDELIADSSVLGLKTFKKHSQTVPLREIFFFLVVKMSDDERGRREISEVSGKYYKKIYGLQFSR